MALFAVAAAAFAQPASQPELEECATIAAAEERLRCFEMLTRRGAEPPAGSARALPLESVPLSPAGDSDAAEPVIQGSEPSTDPELLPEPAQDTGKSPPREDSAADPLADIGAAQLRNSTRGQAGRQSGAMSAMVVEVSEGLRGNLYFHLENGQIWRQIEARHVPLPTSEPFAAQISRGLFGEYRLRAGEKGRLVRIRRVR